MIRPFITATLVIFSTAAIGRTQTPNRTGQSQATSAANRQTPAPTASPQENPTSVTTTVTTTLTGCLYREDQVPGRKPNIAEQAGILEDYILAEATIPSDQGKAGATPERSGDIGQRACERKLYKVENIPDERLKALLGKKVQVTGRIDPQRAQAPGRPGSATGAPTPDLGPGPDRINLPELEAISIREISGKCPATPTQPK